MRIKHFIIILTVFGISLFSASFADEDRNPLDSSYAFYLYYDNGQLFADRDYEFKYDVVPESFVPETLSTQFPYRGEVINLVNEVSRNFNFDPKKGDTNLTKGKIEVKAPYVPDGQKVIFYNYQNQPLLTIPVSESSFCNDDGICNADKGEDSLTCFKDCRQALPTQVSTEDPGESSGSSGVVWGIVILLVGIILGAGFWFWRRRRQADLNTLSTGGLPTPPVPPDQNNPV